MEVLTQTTDGGASSDALVLLDCVDDGLIVVDSEECIKLVNESAAKLLHLDRHACVGHTLADTVHLYAELSDTEPVDLLGEASNQPARPGIADQWQGAMVLSLRDGPMLRNVRIASRIVNSKTTALIFRDVTDIARNREELHFMQFAFDRTADAIFWADPDKRILYVNDAACDHLGYTRDELLHMSVPDFSVKHDPEKFAERWEFLKQNRYVRYESLHRHKSGELIPIELSLNLMQYEDRTFTCAIIRDITERREKEVKLESLNKQFTESSRQAGKAEVATSVLHNVGNVLNSVNVSAGLIQDKVHRSGVASLTRTVGVMEQHLDDLADFVTKDERGKHLPRLLIDLSQQMESEEQLILEEVNSLISNIDHIKAIVATQQAHASGLSSVVEEVSLFELLEDAIRINMASMTRHSITITRHCDDVGLVTVDKQKFLQIVVNLISNAKYACMESGNKDHQLTVRLRRTGEDCVSVEVQDNGMGIDAENMTNIFAHGFTTREEGHGFGLHSAALAAKELGGSLTARSDGPGTGATFTLEIPYQSSQRSTLSDQPEKISLAES